MKVISSKFTEALFRTVFSKSTSTIIRQHFCDVHVTEHRSPREAVESRPWRHSEATRTPALVGSGLDQMDPEVSANLSHSEALE